MKEPLTRERALELHRQMWGDMQAELGDNPWPMERESFKERWIKEHFPGEHVMCDCFLCQYGTEVERRVLRGKGMCAYCPIDWSPGSALNMPGCAFPLSLYREGHYVDYRRSPISKILALPEREVPDDKLS